MTVAAARLGDMCTGHDGFPARPSAGASPNVYINNFGTLRVGDPWQQHTRGSSHTSTQGGGSPNIFVNSMALARVGDAVLCGSRVATGSPNVLAN